MRPAERIQRQYERLVGAYGYTVALVTVSDIADVLYCSPGHARVLLQEMRKNKWVSWIGYPGRGAKGQLQCLFSGNSLSEEQISNEITSSEVFSKNAIKANDLPWGLEMTVYRPVTLLAPSLFSACLERHLFRMIYCGLLRYLPSSQEPMIDLAHNWSANDDNLSWRVYIR